jgi:putative ATPase
MATAPKSNASYLAIEKALSDVREGRTLPVPKHLRDTHYQGSKRLGHGQEYKYAHDFEGGFVPQDYLGVDKVYYEPTDRGYEAEIAARLARQREQIKAELSRQSDSADANNKGADVS